MWGQKKCRHKNHVNQGDLVCSTKREEKKDRIENHGKSKIADIQTSEIKKILLIWRFMKSSITLNYGSDLVLLCMDECFTL